MINGILVRIANPFLYSVGSRNVDMESHKNTCKIKKIIKKVENEKMEVFTMGHGSKIAGQGGQNFLNFSLNFLSFCRSSIAFS